MARHSRFCRFGDPVLALGTSSNYNWVHKWPCQVWIVVYFNEQTGASHRVHSSKFAVFTVVLREIGNEAKKRGWLLRGMLCILTSEHKLVHAFATLPGQKQYPDSLMIEGLAFMNNNTKLFYLIV